ncbi:MAG TPA: hypothetical protein VEQ58_11980 [Polyangiaceae bacterium]|nr:hypothetical protein [Polyangiaceae bacterium]
MLGLLLLTACRDNVGAPIRIVLGATANDELTLTPRASLAELIEISPTETALLLTLTSAARTCDALPQDEPDAASVALRLWLPGAAKLEPGTFPLLEGTPTSDKPYAVATVKLHGRRQELRAGGDLQLTQVDSSPQGSLEGLLKLEFTGDATHPATRVSGHFLARFCRINRLR